MFVRIRYTCADLTKQSSNYKSLYTSTYTTYTCTSIGRTIQSTSLGSCISYIYIFYIYIYGQKLELINLIKVLIANWLEGRTIKYTNFPAKYMNSRSKLHWNIHVVLCRVSVTWNKRRGIGIPELHDHAERHSTFNTTSKWISLIFYYFYDIFFGIFPINVMFASILTLKTSTKLALITKL